MKSKRLPQQRQQTADDLKALGHVLKMRALLDFFSAPSDAVVKPLTARRAVHPSRLKPFWPDAQRAAEAWLDEKGVPQAGDGGQAKLENYIADWLERRGHEAAQSTTRRYVSAWIDARRNRLACLGSTKARSAN